MYRTGERLSSFFSRPPPGIGLPHAIDFPTRCKHRFDNQRPICPETPVTTPLTRHVDHEMYWIRLLLE